MILKKLSERLLKKTKKTLGRPKKKNIYIYIKCPYGSFEAFGEKMYIFCDFWFLFIRVRSIFLKQFFLQNHFVAQKRTRKNGTRDGF